MCITMLNKNGTLKCFTSMISRRVEILFIDNFDSLSYDWRIDSVNGIGKGLKVEKLTLKWRLS